MLIIFYIFLVASGIFLTGFGLWAIHSRTGFWRTAGGFLAPVGLLLALLGALLLCVPHFFVNTLPK